MSGNANAFFAEVRARTKERDPFIDLDTVPPLIIEPILNYVQKWRDAPRSERTVQLFGVQFTIRRGPHGPLIRFSELMAVFDQYRQLAAASAEAARQQSAEIEAESGLTVVTGTSANLKDRLLRAAQAEAKLAQELNKERLQVKALAREVEVLNAERAALKNEIARRRAQEQFRIDASSKVVALEAEKSAALNRISEIAHERDVLASQVGHLILDSDKIKKEHADLHRRLQNTDIYERKILEEARQQGSSLYALKNQNITLMAEKKALEQELGRQKVSGELIRATIADSKKILADSIALRTDLNNARADAKTEHTKLIKQNDALAKRIATLLRETAVLKNENERWQVQSQSGTRAAVRYWAEIALSSSKPEHRSRD